jgi:N-acetylglutamate synthase-like GNAT family acetyltransferase
MLPLSAESVARHQLSTGAYYLGELVGYAAISVIYSKDVIEFGGLVVNSELRRLKVGSGLTRAVVEQARNEIDPTMILAFGNTESGELFKKLGASQVENVQALPSEVWKLCYICPRQELANAAGKSCCERVYDITSINT